MQVGHCQNSWLHKFILQIIISSRYLNFNDVFTTFLTLEWYYTGHNYLTNNIASEIGELRFLWDLDVGKTCQHFFLCIGIYQILIKCLWHCFHFQLGENNLSGTLPMEMGRYEFIAGVLWLNVGELIVAILSLQKIPWEIIVLLHMEIYIYI